ncbi:MAG: sensor histidine kinase [Acidiferrobacter sp.]
MSASDHALELALDGVETPLLAREQNWQLLAYFNRYRLTLALLACVAGLAHGALAPFGSTDPQLFLWVALPYAALYVVALDVGRRQLGEFETQAALLAFLDVCALILMMYASGGLRSGTGILLLVSIAGTSFLLSRRMTIFFAALATIGILLEHSWPYLTGQTSFIPTHYPQVGLFGLTLFVTATLSYLMAQRLRTTEALAEKQEIDLINLARLNEQIVSQLQSGVVVVDNDGRVRLMNGTARTFLGALAQTAQHPLLQALNAPLYEQWRLQKADPTSGRRLVPSPAGYSLLPRFRPLGERDRGTVIFLEDTAILKQQAQQLKMSALARLTAGIAHEIRNPLGAITHAAQLLLEATPAQGEAKDLAAIIDDQGRRMNTIVENVLQLGRRDRTQTRRLALDDWLRQSLPAIATALNVPVAALSLVIDQTQTVCFDGDQLFQIVNNLCHNALKHSAPYTDQPLIKLLETLDADGLTVLDVIDWGSGIKAAIADHIFDPFFTTTARGTGLGLYIARELAEANGARLDYHAETTGARFRLTFGRLTDCNEAPLTP